MLLLTISGNQEEGKMQFMGNTETHKSIQERVWFLDSGCSNHMCGNKEWFFDLDENFREFVKLGDNSRVAVKGKGKLKLQVNELTHVITEVYLIPDLENNLLSLGQLQHKGLILIFRDNLCKIFHKTKGLIMTSRMETNRLYPIAATILSSTCLQATVEEETKLWHQMYGHLGIKGLKYLAQKNIVKGLPDIGDIDEVCSDCLQGK